MLCTYCGMPADTMDHVIPKAYASMLYDVNADRRKILKNFGERVPACRQCNSILGAAPMLTVASRRQLVRKRLKRKYQRLLDAPDWTEAELDTLGRTLRTHVIARQQRKQELRERLAWKGDDG